MKILHAIHSVNPSHGGTSTAVKTLAGHCVQQGHPTTTVCLDDPNAPWLPPWGSPIWGCGPGLFRYGWSASFRRTLRKEAAGSDLIVIHGLWQFHASAARQFSRATGIPYIVAPHGMLDPWSLRQTLPKRMLKKFSWWFDTRAVLRDSSAIWYTTEGEQAAAAAAVGRIKAQQVILPLGVDGPVGDMAQLRSDWLTDHSQLAHKNILLFLGRLHPKKGCDLLIEGFAAWKRDSPHALARNAHLRFVGPAYEPNYLEGLIRLAGSHGLILDRDISFVGMVTGNVKWAELASASALVLPSHQENFGIVVCEALACGMPALVSNRVNLWEAVIQGGAGFTAEPSSDGVTQLLAQWARTSPDGHRQLRENARKLYLEQFQPSAAATAFLKMANNLVICHTR